jgi:peptidoglycan hydrolase-like protein with peptidoglycan-binding domain
MLFGFLTLITALAISAVAIYYSVAGLVAIFAAAALPIMLMGGTLEVAKLVTAVWLHKYWREATWWLKTYLATAVVVLMFITSMGIFGFLSKAHIEQTSASQESVARSEVLQQEIDRQIAIVGRAENEIRKLESTGTGSDANIQAQINAEQERIDRAYERIQPAIAEQQRIIDNQGKIFRDELARLDEKLATLQGYIDAGGRENIQKAQQMVGARADGAFGPNTAQAFRDWQTARQQERADLLAKIESATNNPQARAAANEIRRLRQGVESQIAESNKLINRLRQNIGKTDNTEQIQKSIDEQNERIRTASSEIEKLTQEKIAIDSEYRKLEAEVGPIKYIAEFIYGNDADKNMLEEAVRWVIIVIIFVFDPLAVLLLIASQYTFEYHRRNKGNDSSWLRPLEETDKEKQDDIPMEKADADADATVRDLGTEEPVSDNDATGSSVEQTEVQSNGLTPDEVARPYVEIEKPVEEEPVEKKDIESSEDSRLTEEELDALDEIPEWQAAKQKWKDENPNHTLKFYKRLYLEGKLDKLPWEDYVNDKNYIVKEGTTQVTKTREEGYIQNEEQSDSSLWKKINRQK